MWGVEKTAFSGPHNIKPWKGGENILFLVRKNETKSWQQLFVHVKHGFSKGGKVVFQIILRWERPLLQLLISEMIKLGYPYGKYLHFLVNKNTPIFNIWALTFIYARFQQKGSVESGARS